MITTAKMHSRKASAVPGDQTRELTRAATDGSGKVWPRGTRFAPLAGGYSNPARATYVDVTIAGERVRFYPEEASR